MKTTKKTLRRPITTDVSRAVLLLSGLAAFSGVSVSAQAQKAPQRATDVMLEEVVVTARKRTELAQDVPVAVTAYNGDQLGALKVRDLEDLSVGIPNVALDTAGTVKGYQNFSIRGMGLNSSIVSIDPTVGIFVDGVYMGLSGGVVFDMFDLESVQVLRGPQGILFGRNVTGGAILLNTRKPGPEFEASVKAAVDAGEDGGPNTYLMGTVSGPITDSFAGKFTAYYNKDDGWFENGFTGDDFGESKQTMYRTVAVWTPAEDMELILRYEHSNNDSDGPAAQSHTNGSGVPGSPVNNKRNSFDFSIDEVGSYNTGTDFATMEFNMDVDFGNGTITNIFGWRDYNADSYIDVDSQPVWLYHSGSNTDAEQYSNELRYNGVFAERANVTTGIFYFDNDIDYHERRQFLGVLTGNAGPYQTLDGGGHVDVQSVGVFAALDYDFSDALTLNAGIRYSYEEKKAEIASLPLNLSYFGEPTCNLVHPQPGEASCPIDFQDQNDWDSWTPKLGLTYHLSDDSLMYGFWTRGFRSGGYNVRNTSVNPDDTPGPFDEETVDSYEIGLKSEFGLSRLNAAVFYNQVDDMQREIGFPGAAGTVQLTRNSADADIYGAEVDGTLAVTDSLVLMASVGWTHAEYTNVLYDLNRDGVIDGKDKGLDIPRAAEWTYSVGLNHDLELGSWGYLSSRINYAYRDDSYYSDDNLGTILDQEILDAGMDFHSNDGHWVVGVYGKNLLDTVKHGGDFQLPDEIAGMPWGGTFAPLAKGRVYGLQLTYNL